MRALTREIKDPKFPVCRFLTQHFGNTKDVQRQYRDAVEPFRLPGNSANPGTLGTANVSSDVSCRLR
ncbi:hypothetical protein [Amycolatopsis pigmentata]|uniref:Uncharacterized protein n=1 Tax=Amycolatopsis pigmentata TaxID=450801 RepID=A0ABW5GAE0_9PSEU